MKLNLDSFKQLFKMKEALSVILLTYGLTCAAQEDFLITNTKDTLYGKIYFPVTESPVETITIKNKSGKKEFSANHVLSCQVKDVDFKVVRFDSRKRIMQVIVTDYLSLYRFRKAGEFDFSTDFLQIKDQGFSISPIEFKKVIIPILQDCPQLSRKVQNKEYKYKDLIEIVKEYNSTCMRGENTNTQSAAEIQQLMELQTSLKEALQMYGNNEPIPEKIKNSLKGFAEQDINAYLVEFLNQID